MSLKRVIPDRRRSVATQMPSRYHSNPPTLAVCEPNAAQTYATRGETFTSEAQIQHAAASAWWTSKAYPGSASGKVYKQYSPVEWSGGYEATPTRVYRSGRHVWGGGAKPSPKPLGDLAGTFRRPSGGTPVSGSTTLLRTRVAMRSTPNTPLTRPETCGALNVRSAARAELELLDDAKPLSLVTRPPNGRRVSKESFRRASKETIVTWTQRARRASREISARARRASKEMSSHMPNWPMRQSKAFGGGGFTGGGLFDSQDPASGDSSSSMRTARLQSRQEQRRHEGFQQGRTVSERPF